ncbi:MAG: c-type cytochrome [Anaerolineales bacterium]|nr:c-type cytochrome [Anaerolineales bacterium]
MRLQITIGFIAAILLALILGVSIFYEPYRQDRARADLAVAQIRAAQVVYGQNCAICHGGAGEGLGANPALDNAGLRSADYEAIYKTIARGRYNTAMPGWAMEDGGSLNIAAIDSLVTLIQKGDWTQTRVVVADLGLMPRVPVSVTIPAETLKQIAALPDGTRLTNGAQLYASNCVSCHGANGTGTKLAPALNDPKIRTERTGDQLIKSINLGNPGTLMAGWNQRLKPDQVGDLVLLIQQWDKLPPNAIPAPPAQPIVVTPKMLETGKTLYSQNCSWCHGTEGQGTRRAPSLNVKSFFEKVTNDEAMIQIVTNGVPKTAMPAWGDRLGASEIQAIVAYVRQWEAAAPAVASPQTGGGGPAWMRNNPAPNPQPVAPQQGSGRQTQTQASALQQIDWRAVAMLGVMGWLCTVLLVFSVSALWKLR